jgi:hypothetical protein
MAALQRNHGLLIVVAVLTWLFAGSEIFQRATIELHGKVVSSETSCVQPQNNRCATEYVVERNDHVQKRYVAGPTDKSLRRGLPVGSEIDKDKWALAYAIDGVPINDFPSAFYGGLLAFGFCCALLWSALAMRKA